MMKTSKNDNKKLLRDWKVLLYNKGKLSEREINKRAKEFARKGMKPNVCSNGMS